MSDCRVPMPVFNKPASKPLGIDRLGRLVYEGDTMRGLNGAWFVVRDNSIPFIANPLFTVDLDASPKRTNYQRFGEDQ